MCACIDELFSSISMCTCIDRPDRRMYDEACRFVIPPCHLSNGLIDFQSPYGSSRPFSSTTKRACFDCRYLGYNKLTGNIPESFSTLTGLTTLCVSLYPSMHAFCRLVFGLRMRSPALLIDNHVRMYRRALCIDVHMHMYRPLDRRMYDEACRCIIPLVPSFQRPRRL